jgi:magnesium-transporting ATPase (P-type)
MTRAEYLAFDYGIKDGLWIYLKRLSTFLAVFVAAFLICGMVAIWFIPRPEQTKLTGNENHLLEIMTSMQLVIWTILMSARVFFRRNFAATLSFRIGRYVVLTLLLVSALFGVTLIVLTHDFMLALGVVSAFSVFLVEALVFLRERGNDEERRKSHVNR